MYYYENPELQSLMDQIEGQIQELESDPQSVKQKDEFKFCDIFYNELSRLLRVEPHHFTFDESYSIAKDTLSNFNVSIPDNIISENDIEISAKHFANIASRYNHYSERIRCSLAWSWCTGFGFQYKLVKICRLDWKPRLMVGFYCFTESIFSLIASTSFFCVFVSFLFFSR